MVPPYFFLLELEKRSCQRNNEIHLQPKVSWEIEIFEEIFYFLRDKYAKTVKKFHRKMHFDSLDRKFVSISNFKSQLFWVHSLLCSSKRWKKMNKLIHAGRNFLFSLIILLTCPEGDIRLSQTNSIDSIKLEFEA